MKRMLVVLLFAASAAMSSAAMAEVYKWVDKEGRVHYSDRPEPGAVILAIVSRRTDPEAIAERNEAASSQRAQDTVRDQQRRADQATAATVQKDVSAAREEQCKKAREQYTVAIESIRLYKVGKDGERQYLNDAELAEARIAAKKNLDAACGSSS
jgi:hypothetical protein